MSRQVIITEIETKPDKVWSLITDPKEVSFWAPNVRELTMDPPGKFGVDSIRCFRLDVGGKIETLDTRITHCENGSMFAETPIGGTLEIHKRVSKMKIIYRVDPVDEKTCSLTFSVEYEMEGFMNKMLEKVYMGAFSAQYKLWFERLKTYAETGRVI